MKCLWATAIEKGPLAVPSLMPAFAAVVYLYQPATRLPPMPLAIPVSMNLSASLMLLLLVQRVFRLQLIDDIGKSLLHFQIELNGDRSGRRDPSDDAALACGRQISPYDNANGLRIEGFDLTSRYENGTAISRVCHL